MEFEILDCHDLTAEQIVDYMIELNPDLRSLIKRQKVYVGATGNIEERLSRHNAKTILFCARTASQRVAAEVERVAAARGFNIGKVEQCFFTPCLNLLSPHSSFLSSSRLLLLRFPYSLKTPNTYPAPKRLLTPPGA